jgi:hypothetical protein
MVSNSGDVVTFSKASSETAEHRAADVRQDVYKQSGVDTAEAEAGLAHIIRRVQGTWPKRGTGRILLPIGFFANVIALCRESSRLG